MMKPSPFRQKERGGQPRALAPVSPLFIDTHSPPSRAVPKMAQKRCCRVEVFGEAEESYVRVSYGGVRVMFQKSGGQRQPSCGAQTALRHFLVDQWSFHFFDDDDV